MNLFFDQMLLVLVLLLWGCYLTIKTRFAMQMLQQNSYRTARFSRWIKSNLSRSFRAAELVAFLLCGVSAIYNYWLFLGVFAVSSYYLYRTFPRAREKKPIVYTSRVARLIFTTIALWMACLFSVLYVGEFRGEIASTLMFLPLGLLIVFPIVIVANWLNIPFELLLQAFYVRDARKKMALYDDLKVIGITGSYGKTTVKNIINNILTAKFNTLMTPESYNTKRGVTRTVREKLNPIHQAFVVEMGAKQKGDIAEICELVHPQIAVLSAIGPQHLETFKTLKNIQNTKFELVESLSADGIAVLNWDDENIRSYLVKSNCRVIKYGMVSEGLDFRAFDCKYDQSGMAFKVEIPHGETLFLQTKLLGSLNVYNILAGVVVAVELGITSEQITQAVRKLEPIKHRLSMMKQPGGVTIIDDSFNSNPKGSAMALEVLKQMPGMRIMMTPGMIELGDQEYELNKAFGAKAANACDYVVLVGKQRTKAIYEGLRDGGLEQEKIFIAENLFAGFAHLKTCAGPGSYVLLENDLPDSFNE